MKLALFLAAAIASIAGPPRGAGSAPRVPRGCMREASGPTAAEWLRRSEEAVGMTLAAPGVVHFHGVEAQEQNYQSDRTYPPFFSSFVTRDLWFDPRTGVERIASEYTTLGGDFTPPTYVGTAAASYVPHGDTLVPAGPAHREILQTRALDPWAVLWDWSAAGDAVVDGRCVYRDYARVVLRRSGPFGPERLFLDAKTAFPVKLERVEAHYLWGQQRVEYIYETWLLDAGAAHPGAVFRVADGDVEVSRSVDRFLLTRRDSAPPLAAPAGDTMSLALPIFLQALPTDTARVGRHAFVLRNQGYGEVVALARDTVIVLDATQSEARARQDSAWIGRLFPGRHPVLLVVTDLAWPHVGGVRFWVASGATVVSRRTSRAFLERVVGRRWTRAPDKLERLRVRPPLRFRPVGDSLRLAGGDVVAYAIDGAASEGALAVYLPADRFLWGSDYVQDLSRPTLYALEVERAVARVGVHPATVAAEHLPATTWDDLLRANAGIRVEAPR